jgi:hypothetical protein
MKFSEYLRCGATALARHVARGDVTLGDLLDIALQQCLLMQPRINAVCRLME